MGVQQKLLAWQSSMEQNEFPSRKLVPLICSLEGKSFCSLLDCYVEDHQISARNKMIPPQDSCGEEISDLKNFKEKRKATLKEVIGQIMISSDVRLFPKLCHLYCIIVDYDLCAKIGIIILESQMNSGLIITRIGLNFVIYNIFILNDYVILYNFMC